MRILHIMSQIDPKMGGPPAVLRGMAISQAQLGLDVKVLAIHVAGNDLSIVDDLCRHGVQAQTIGPCTGALGSHPQLRAVVAQQVAQADVVHIHGCWEQIQHEASRAARGQGVPYLITPHGMLGRWALSRSALKKKLYLALRMRRNLNRAALLHFTSEFERQNTLALGLKPPSIVEPAGVDLREFEELPARGTFRALHPTIGGRPMVAYLGRIFPAKGLESLIPAMAQVQPASAVLVVIGPGEEPYFSGIKNLVAQHGLEGRVIFTGMLRGRDKIAALVDADLFCLASDHENFGMVVIEALAAGTPVVVSDQVGIHHDITGGRLGAVVERSPAALSKAISEWLQDETMRSDAAKRARPFVWKHYALPAIAQHWMEHYQRLVGHAAPHAETM